MGLLVPRFACNSSTGGFRFPARYYILILFSIIILHILLSTVHDDYREVTSLSRIAPNWMHSDQSNEVITYSWASYEPSWSSLEGDHYPSEKHIPQLGLANATFVILVRNKELKDIVNSLRELEETFNYRYHYPYVFLNDEPFNDEFKEVTSNMVSSKVAYGVIPPNHWHQPDHIDERKAKASREEMVRQNIPYGDSVPYRNMCRFNSGFFFRHPLLQQYRYYWRVEPSVNFFCDVEDDPFVFMEENNKVYGFTISLYEFEATIPTLWKTTKEFMKEHPQYIPRDNALHFLSDDGKSYNLCHYWSNFEIADMDFWRSEAYMKYFEYLDAKGGFYYERWGDAPVHTIGVSLLARKDQIHFFKQIGYRHHPFQHCPQGELHQKGKCRCDEKDNFDYQGYSCTARFEGIHSTL